MIHVLSVVGARPQFVKLAPVAKAMAAEGLRHTIVHTGQHYDPQMSDNFFRDLDLAAPKVNLNIGSGSHGAQTGQMLAGLETVIQEESPDVVLVYGDTNSTLAAALAAVKIGVKTAHLEAGLRSHNRAMPEEINRVLTDHAADLCLAPTQAAMGQLDLEGLGPRSVLVGDVMVDITLQTREKVLTDPPQQSFDPTEPYVLCTMHRPSNVDSAPRLREIIHALSDVPVPVVLAVHPRLRASLQRFGLGASLDNITMVEPLTYPQMIHAMTTAVGLVTDSGGLQKEAYVLGLPCITVRAETEWMETLEGGWNLLSPDCSLIPALASRPTPTAVRTTPYGTGSAAKKVASGLRSWLNGDDASLLSGPVNVGG